MTTQRNPWLALIALVVGFFMILLDTTIVAVANPAIMTDLHTDITKVIWVTSAYLLAYAVPLLVTGRLGDRYGPKNIYLTGLVVFTLSSLWCGMSGSIGMLIAARAVQGIGAAMMTPQTMAVITRTFPPQRRGAAMGLWGAVAGLATLVGPILGGVLVDQLGWNWIFYINVPIGVVAFAMAWILVPTLETHKHRFDLVGVGLSAVGMLLLVFGLQEGNTHHWNQWIWTTIIAGIVVLAVFLISQARTSTEPLVPLTLFKDRNFSLANVGIAAMGATMTSLIVPAYFYLEAVRGYSPTRAGLVFAPMAITTGIFGPFIGRISDRLHPRILPTLGFGLFAVVVFGFALLMKPHSSIVAFILLGVVAGFSNSCIWAPLGSTATRNMPIQRAGAASGIYNTTRQVGSVLGSAAASALIAARVSANGIHGWSGGSGPGSDIHKLQSSGRMAKATAEFLLDRFSTSLGQSILLPALILLVGAGACALFVANHPKPPVAQREKASAGAR